MGRLSYNSGMVFPGHIAAAYLAAHYGKLDERVAFVAAVFPDAIDKTARYVLHLTPNGRVPAHSLLVLAATTVLVWLVWRRRPLTLAWVAGYASHLLADLLTDLLQYGGNFDFLLWPIVPPSASRYSTLFGSVIDYGAGVYLLELAVCAWAIVVALRARRMYRLSHRRSIGPESADT